jgi:hypothetical protein
LTKTRLTRIISAVPVSFETLFAGGDFHETQLDTPAFCGEFSGILGTSFSMTGGGALC